MLLLRSKEQVRQICYSPLMGEHNHPEITMHAIPMAEYMPHLERDHWKGVADLMLVSTEKLARAGADFAICPDNTCHTIIFKELVNAIFPEESRLYFNEVMDSMKQRGCDAAVLGCTEIPLIVRPDDAPLPTLDSTRLLAKAALLRAMTAH